MIEIHRQNQVQETKIKLAGIGGAGSNLLDRVLLDGVLKAETMVLNTDTQALVSSVAAHKIQLGQHTTRGLGTGGDPEIGLAATEEALEEIQQAFKEAALVFLCAGLGGGTGSGATPLAARLAREQGALVVAFVTIPFSFEGKRRAKQALEALAQLQQEADVVLCFENDKMGEAVSPKAGVQQAFAAADQTISQSVRAICELFQRPGLLRIGFEDLATAVRNSNSRCIFGFGEGEGDNRAHEALARALKNPLMERGHLLEQASAVVVNVVGGPTMTLNEIQILMEELNKHVGDNSQLLFGTAVDPKMGSRMSVTILSSLSVAGLSVAVVPEKKHRPGPPVELQKIVEPAPQIPAEEEMPKTPVRKPGYVEAIQDDFLGMEEAVTAQAELPAEEAPKNQRPAPTKPREEKQENLPFDKPSKGRFDKSEPTIVDGEDLDLPTFMRRKVKLK